jgi:outer membrane assembly lipoprotein YfiO
MNRKPLLSGFVCSILLCLGLIFGGCGASNPYPPGTFERGQFFLDQENYTDAVPALETFVRQNPTDSLAVNAQFMKARTLMELEQYPLAAVEFQILRKDYPTDSLVEDAYFYEGVAYFDQVGNIERDVTGAYEARLHFLGFSEEFPNSRYMTEVVQYMRDISDIMVAKRIQQVKIYEQLRRYKSVAKTLDIVLEDEAGSTLLDEVLWRRAEIAVKLEDYDEARSFYMRLLDNYPESDFSKQAQNALKNLQDNNLQESTSGDS